MPAQELQAAQLVARAGDGLRFVEAVDAHHLELPDHGQAEKGDRGADARNDGIDRPDRLALVEQLGVTPAEADVELQRVHDLDVMAACSASLRQRPGAVQRLLPRQYDDSHESLANVR